MNIAETILRVAEVIGAIIVILGAFAYIFKIRDWVKEQDKQEEEIEKLKKENCLLCYGMSACLDGLMQLGANHTVPLAKEELDKYLNKTAHS